MRSTNDSGVMIHVPRMDCSLSGCRLAPAAIKTTWPSNNAASHQVVLRCEAGLAVIKQGSGVRGQGSGQTKPAPGPRHPAPASQAVMDHGVFPAHAVEQVEIGEHL